MNHQLPREQLIGLIKMIMSGDGSEEQVCEWMSILEKNVPDPNVSDLIFYQETALSPEEIIDRAMAYKPICLYAPSVDNNMCLTREELLSLTREILSFRGPEREYAALQAKFCESVPNPVAVEMFSQTIDPNDAEKIVAVAMTNKQINL